jgi:hypothetical protein
VVARILGVVALLFVLALAPTAPAHAAPGACSSSYPPVCPTLTLSGSVIPKGGSLTATIFGFKGAVDVALSIASDPAYLGTVRTNADGGASATITIPANFDAGNHTVSATGQNKDGVTTTATAALAVTGAAAAGSGLVRTGARVALYSGVAIALIGCGSMLVVGARRRRVAS